MPITTNSTGYFYIFVDHSHAQVNKMFYSYNDNTTNATNVGSTSSIYGPAGNYEYLMRWNFEIQTNFTKADTTDYSLEIARSKIISANTDP